MQHIFHCGIVKFSTNTKHSRINHISTTRVNRR